MKSLKFFIILFLGYLIFSAFISQQLIEKLSMGVQSRTLKNGKMVVGEGEIFYSNNSGGEMTMHILKPLESFMQINAKGELKIYDPVKNTVLIQSNSGISSQSSFMYYFLNGSSGDMGLKAGGFNISDTKFKDGMVITTWLPPPVMVGIIGQAVLVHENYKLIYMAGFNSKSEPALKVYYSNYTKIEDLSFPLSVTEIHYTSPVDSTIEKYTYSNVKVNDKVNIEFANFKIPENAKIVE